VRSFWEETGRPPTNKKSAKESLAEEWGEEPAFYSPAKHSPANQSFPALLLARPHPEFKMDLLFSPERPKSSGIKQTTFFEIYG